MTRRPHAARPTGDGNAVARHASKRPPAAAPVPEIQQALNYIRQQIDDGRLRPTIADLVRLLEIRQRQQPAEIVAYWYSPRAPADTCPACHRPNILKCTQCGHREKAQPYTLTPPTPLQEQPL